MTAPVPERWVDMVAETLPGGVVYMPNAVLNRITAQTVLTPVLADLLAQVADLHLDASQEAHDNARVLDHEGEAVALARADAYARVLALLITGSY